MYMCIYVYVYVYGSTYVCMCMYICMYVCRFILRRHEDLVHAHAGSMRQQKKKNFDLEQQRKDYQFYIKVSEWMSE